MEFSDVFSYVKNPRKMQKLGNLGKRPFEARGILAFLEFSDVFRYVAISEKMQKLGKLGRLPFEARGILAYSELSDVFSHLTMSEQMRELGELPEAREMTIRTKRDPGFLGILGYFQQRSKSQVM